MGLADKAIFNILSQSSGTIILLVSSIFYVRLLNQQDYGTFLQVMLISNTVIMLGFLGLPQSIYYFFQVEPRKDVFLLRTIGMTAVLSVLFALALLALRQPIAKLFDNPDLAQYYWAVWLLVLLGFLTRLREPILWSNESLMLSGYLTLVSSLLQLAIPTVGLFWGGTVFHVLLFMVLGNVVNLFIHLGVYWRVICEHRVKILAQTFDNGKPVRTAGFMEQMRYAIPIGLSSYAGVIGREMDKYFISSWFNPAQFAVYSRGSLEVPLVSTIRFTLNNIMMPRFVSLFKTGNVSGLIEQWHTLTEQLAKINYGVFALLWAVTPSLIRILYTDAYMGAAPIFRAYLFLLLNGVCVYNMIPRISGQTRLVLWAALFTLPINVVLCLVFIKWLGVIGPAIATVATSYIVMFWLLQRSAHIVDRTLISILPWKRLAGILAVAMVVSLPLYVIEQLHRFSGLKGVAVVGVESALFAAIYLFSLKRCGFLSTEECQTIERWSGPLPVSWLLR